MTRFLNYFITNFNIRISEGTIGHIFDVPTRSCFDIISSSYSKSLNFDSILISADPFLFSYNNELFLFYEEYRHLKAKGTIKMIKTTDMKVWTSPKSVLEEKHHLSFPFIFNHCDSVYMIPESGDDYSVSLYIGNHDLTDWTLVKKIIDDGTKYVDSHLFIEDGYFYLFSTEITKENRYVLNLFVSDSLCGTYIKHPSSPIAEGLEKARSAGALICLDKDKYRVSQDCSLRYGGDINVFKICEITPKTYKENILITNLFKNNKSFYKYGGHHISVVYFKNKYFIATDAKAMCCNSFVLLRVLRQILCRVINILKKTR